MDGNGYDARGEDLALQRRCGELEHAEILKSVELARLSEEVAGLRADIYARDEQLNRSEALVQRIAERP